MQVEQFRYASDNLAYLVYGPRTALAVDGGAVDDILAAVDRRGLKLAFAVNTHGHPDHTAGTDELVQRAAAIYLDKLALLRAGRVDIDGETLRVLHTPGHTLDSLTFAAEGILITGDTLFNGTVGNCFSEDLKSFYESICLLARFPDDTLIYAGHDYVHESIAFARTLEPENQNFDRYLSRYDAACVRSTLGEERAVNPYLRFNEPGMVAMLRRRGLAVETEYERWLSLMRI